MNSGKHVLVLSFSGFDPKATSLDRPWEYRKDAPVNRAEGALMQSKMASWAFVLGVPDINKSAEYFRDFLGFRR